MIVLILLGAFSVSLAGFFIFLTFMISKNLSKLRKNIDYNQLRLEAILNQRKNEIKKLIMLCKTFKAYRKESFNELESILEKIDKNKLKTSQYKLESKLEEESDKIINNLFNKSFKLKANSSFLRIRLNISLHQIAIKKAKNIHNKEINLYNMRLKQFPDSLFSKRLLPYDAIE